MRCTLNYNDCVVIDSADLANNLHGQGTFRLNSVEDVIRLIPSGSWPPESVGYPRLPTGLGQAPAPFPHGSAAFCNLDFAWAQCFNWYRDSTPTPGAANDNWSTISGCLCCSDNLSGEDIFVYAHGRYAGTCLWEGYGAGDTLFEVSGLGAGWYHLEAYAGGPRGSYQGTYADSVYVGYNQEAFGVNIVLSRVGVDHEDSRQKARSPQLHVVGQELSVECSAPTKAKLTLFDLAGRGRIILHQGPLAPGTHRFGIPPRVAAGIYFARLETGLNTTTTKVVIWR